MSFSKHLLFMVLSSRIFYVCADVDHYVHGLYEGAARCSSSISELERQMDLLSVTLERVEQAEQPYLGRPVQYAERYRPDVHYDKQRLQAQMTPIIQEDLCKMHGAQYVEKALADNKRFSQLRSDVQSRKKAVERAMRITSDSCRSLQTARLESLQMRTAKLLSVAEQQEQVLKNFIDNIGASLPPIHGAQSHADGPHASNASPAHETLQNQRDREAAARAAGRADGGFVGFLLGWLFGSDK